MIRSGLGRCTMSAETPQNHLSGSMTMSQSCLHKVQRRETRKCRTLSKALWENCSAVAETTIQVFGGQGTIITHGRWGNHVGTCWVATLHPVSMHRIPPLEQLPQAREEPRRDNAITASWVSHERARTGGRHGQERSW